jgi:hypothetical protein
MGLQYCHTQDSFFLQFIPQLNKLLVLMHIIFSSHTCSGSQTISELCILTIKFTFSKRKYHSLHFGSAGNWSSLWAYNTSISMTLFSLQFILFTAKQTVSLSCIHVYISIFKTMHTNSSSHLYKHERESHSLSMPHFNIPNLSKHNSTFQRI